MDNACERYGWTVDYILWEVSYTNLMMMMYDQSATLFDFGDEEEKKDVIQADDPANAEAILRRLQR